MKKLLYLSLLMATFARAQDTAVVQATYANDGRANIVLTTGFLSTIGGSKFYTFPKVTRYNADSIFKSGQPLLTYLSGMFLSAVPAAYNTITQNDVRYKAIGYTPAWAEVTGRPTLAAVATTGSYADLLSRPTIPRQTQIDSNGVAISRDSALIKQLQTQLAINRDSIAKLKALLSLKLDSSTALFTTNATGNTATAHARRGRVFLAASTVPPSAAIEFTLTSSLINANSTIKASLNGNGSPIPLLLNLQGVKSQQAGSCILQVANANTINAITTTGLAIDFTVEN